MGLLVTALTALIAAAAVIVAAWSVFFVRRAQHQQWLRERRLDAYANLIGTAMRAAVLGVQNETAKVLAAETDPALLERVGTLQDGWLTGSGPAVSDMLRNLATVELVGPPEVLPQAREVHRRGTEWLSDPYPKADADGNVDTSQDAVVQEFLDAVKPFLQ